MYIEFQLPKQPNEFNHGANYAAMCISADISTWVEKHQIAYHKTKQHKYTIRLILENDKAYSHFSITWEPKYSFSKDFNFKNPK